MSSNLPVPVSFGPNDLIASLLFSYVVLSLSSEFLAQASNGKETGGLFPPGNYTVYMSFLSFSSLFMSFLRYPSHLFSRLDYAMLCFISDHAFPSVSPIGYS